MTRKVKAKGHVPANEERGELALTLDGIEMVLRPTWEAITAFETATGKGLMQLAQEGSDLKLTLGETVQIATECIRAWGRATEDKNAALAKSSRIGELILDSDGGFQAALVTVAAMLALATTGGYTAAGKPKAAPMMTGTTTTDPNGAA